MMDWFTGADFGVVPTNYTALVIGLLLAFACGHAVAWAYMFTHTGLSYSRSYVNSLIMLPVLVALVMMVLANNLVVAFGLMAIFAMVRFRNVLRDTLETSYVLGSIVIGLACGTLKFTTATIGCLATVAIMFYFWATGFGTRQRYDLILNLQWERATEDLADLKPVLQRHCRLVLVSSQRLREVGTGTDVSYRVLLRDPSRGHELLRELQGVAGVGRVSSLKAADESEI